MNCFPLCIDIENKTVYLIGNDRHAVEKLNKLLPYGAYIHIFAENGYDEYKSKPNVIFEGRTVTDEDFNSGELVFVVMSGGTDEEKRSISELCSKRKIPLNVVDDIQYCSFYFPALITKGAFTVAVSSSGKSPAAASIIRQNIEYEIPDNIGNIVDWSEKIRKIVRIKIKSSEGRRLALRKIIYEAIQRNSVLSNDEIEEIITYCNNRIE